MKEVDDFNRGFQHGKRAFIVELFEASQQKEFLEFLYCYTAKPPIGDDTRNERTIGFNAGVRAALRILSSVRKPEEAFQDIVNPSITFEFTKEDYKKFQYDINREY